MIESLTDPDEYKAEILTEYKQSLDITTAIRNAQYRKQQREAELARIEAQKTRAEQARLEAEAVPAPQEEILHYTLSVSGTRIQLRALRQFLETNNINYNIQ